MYSASHHLLEFLSEHVCIILSKDFEREGLDSWSSMIVAKTLNYELDWNIQNFKSSFPAQKWWHWNICDMILILTKSFKYAYVTKRRGHWESSRIFDFLNSKWLNVSINGLKLRNFRVVPYVHSRYRPKLVFIQLNAW